VVLGHLRFDFHLAIKFRLGDDALFARRPALLFDGVEDGTEVGEPLRIIEISISEAGLTVALKKTRSG
jgi:hypothetical protein